MIWGQEHFLAEQGFEPTNVFNLITNEIDRVVTTVDTQLVGLTTMAKKRLHDLLVTLAARPTVQNVAGRGTAALVRGMITWHLTIMLPQVCKVTGMGKTQAAAVAPTPAGAATAAVAPAVQIW